MAATLSYVTERVSTCCVDQFAALLSALLVYTTDLLLQGVLKGFDQCVNVILYDSFERVFSLKEPVEAVELGLYIVRGDNMYVVRLCTSCEGVCHDGLVSSHGRRYRWC